MKQDYDYQQNNYQQDPDFEESRHENHNSSRENCLSPKRTFGNKSGHYTKLNLSSISQHSYTGQVQTKINKFNPYEATSQAIQKQNQAIKRMLKRFNDNLNDILNRNIVLKNHSPKRLRDKNNNIKDTQHSIQVLEQQYQNNKKLEEVSQTQLKNLQQKDSRWQKNQQSDTYQIQINFLNMKIIQIKRQIAKLGKNVNNNGVKLAPLTQGSKKQNSKKYMILRTKITEMKAQIQKNQNKSQNLMKKQQNFSDKIQFLSSKTNGIRLPNMNIIKKHQEVLLKLENAKSHKSKISTLWEKKLSVILHDNEALKQKLKNMEIQIKNIEQSCQQISQKTNNKVNNQINILAGNKESPVDQKLLSRLQKIRASLNGDTNFKGQQKGIKKFSIRRSMHSSNSELLKIEANITKQSSQSHNFKKERLNTQSQKEQRNQRQWAVDQRECLQEKKTINSLYENKQNSDQKPFSVKRSSKRQNTLNSQALKENNIQLKVEIQ